MKLWGEDALLSWPGAMEPIIHKRDAYMARACAAAAAGKPQGLTPAYILTRPAAGGSGSGGGGGPAAVLQYAMPVGGEAGACPPGVGAGRYRPLPGPATVVAVSKWPGQYVVTPTSAVVHECRAAHHAAGRRSSATPAG